MIEGGEDFRVQCLSCLDVQRLPLRFDTTGGKESREILCAPLHIETTEGEDSREILYAPLHVETTTEGRRLTATGCSYASAFDSGKAGGTMVCDRDVTMILNSSVLNAACGTPASIRHGVKGTLSPGCIQSIVPHRHGDRKTSTSVSSQRSYSSRYDLLLVQLPLTDPSTRLVRFCRLLSPCFDGMRPFLTSFNPVLRPLQPHLHEILLLCVPASSTWEGTLRRYGGGDITVICYGFMVDDDLPGMNFGVTISIDAPIHDASR